MKFGKRELINFCQVLANDPDGLDSIQNSETNKLDIET